MDKITGSDKNKGMYRTDYSFYNIAVFNKMNLDGSIDVLLRVVKDDYYYIDVLKKIDGGEVTFINSTPFIDILDRAIDKLELAEKRGKNELATD